MKKLIALFTSLVLCAALACPVFAADFVPSITVKGAPELVLVQNDEGQDVQGLILTDGQFAAYMGNNCLVVTAVADAKTSTLIPDDAEALLLEVYAKLESGEMTLPYEKISADIDASKMVVKDLFDVSWLCVDHPEEVAPKGVCVELTFDLGVAKDTPIYAMSYKGGEWNPIVGCVNNGDGTVTCVFEDFCPVAFAVPMNAVRYPSVQTGDNSGMGMWLALMAGSAAGLVALVAVRRKTNR